MSAHPRFRFLIKEIIVPVFLPFLKYIIRSRFGENFDLSFSNSPIDDAKLTLLFQLLLTILYFLYFFIKKTAYLHKILRGTFKTWILKISDFIKIQ